MILQTDLPYNPFASQGLPGIAPLDLQNWLRPDDCAAAQIGLRRRLLATQTDRVLACASSALEAAQELLAVVRDQLFAGQGDRVKSADGREVTLDFDHPMESLGTITQQDFCILQKPQGQSEHVLTAAVLCFPASWRLADKFMRPLTQIHVPVPEYDDAMARRVQRLFDGVQVGRPLWRFNALWYETADLFHPDRPPVYEGADRTMSGNFLRSEEQTILRLPETGAVVFSIHTRILARADALALQAPVV